MGEHKRARRVAGTRGSRAEELADVTFVLPDDLLLLLVRWHRHAHPPTSSTTLPITSPRRDPHSPIVTARATRPRHAAAAAAFSPPPPHPPSPTHPPSRHRQVGLGGDRTIHGGGALTLTLTLTLTLDLTLTLARTLAWRPAPHAHTLSPSLTEARTESEPATRAHGPEPEPDQVCGRYLRLLRDEGATLWQSCTLADPNPNRPLLTRPPPQT